MGLKLLKGLKERKIKKQREKFTWKLLINPREVMKKRENFRISHNFSVRFLERLGFH